MGQSFARRKVWQSEAAHKKEASDAQSLVRAFECDSTSHSAMVSASESGLCSGEGLERAEKQRG